jgi:aminomethyltransferase
MTDPGLKTLPLLDLHKAAGAKFGGFAGWSMPLTYPLGVMKEHLHTRAQAGLFDISHMKLFAIDGAGAAALLARACPLDPEALGVGQSKYTLLLDADAGIIDDLIVTRLGTTRFMVVANAGNAARDGDLLAGYADGLDCTVEPLDRVFLALQGPAAEDALRNASVTALPSTFMTGLETGDGWFVTRSGYTGEDGFEIGLTETDARALLEKLLVDGRVQWIGLAARDSLRLEAGLCLHGQDITEATDPVAAGLIWAIPKPLRTGGGYTGAEALHKHIALGAPEKRVGLRPEGRQPVRAGVPLTDETGREVGRITSGGFGPTVGHPIAMGYVEAPVAAAASRVYAEVRGTRIAVDIASLPFTPHRYRKG